MYSWVGELKILSRVFLRIYPRLPLLLQASAGDEHARKRQADMSPFLPPSEVVTPLSSPPMSVVAAQEISIPTDWLLLPVLLPSSSMWLPYLTRGHPPVSVPRA